MSPPVEPDALLSSKRGGVGSAVDIGACLCFDSRD